MLGGRTMQSLLDMDIDCIYRGWMHFRYHHVPVLLRHDVYSGLRSTYTGYRVCRLVLSQRFLLMRTKGRVWPLGKA